MCVESTIASETPHEKDALGGAGGDSAVAFASNLVVVDGKATSFDDTDDTAILGRLSTASRASEGGAALVDTSSMA